jgi:hypothetical protein
MIRYPLQGETTIASHQEGLNILKTFFLSKKSSDYPPDSIQIIDHTTKIRPVLDQYFMNNDIEEIFKIACDSKVVNAQFYNTYTTFARKIYLTQEPLEFAKNELGFPSLP